MTDGVLVLVGVLVGVVVGVATIGHVVQELEAGAVLALVVDEGRLDVARDLQALEPAMRRHLQLLVPLTCSDLPQEVLHVDVALVRLNTDLREVLVHAGAELGVVQLHRRHPGDRGEFVAQCLTLRAADVLAQKYADFGLAVQIAQRLLQAGDKQPQHQRQTQCHADGQQIGQALQGCRAQTLAGEPQAVALML